VWVIENTQDLSQVYAVRWNGQHWSSRYSFPNDDLQGIGTSSAAQAWVVGFNQNTGANVSAQFSSGGSWTKQTAPDPGDSNVTQADFFDVSAASSRFVVAIGQNGTECGFGPGFADIYTNGVWRTQRVSSGSSRPDLPLPFCGG
jgi:hypothetical protein